MLGSRADADISPPPLECSESILQPRPVLTLRDRDDGSREVKFPCDLQKFQEPHMLDVVRGRKTESPTLSTHGRAMMLQLIASCRFEMVIGDVQSAFLRADRSDPFNEIIPKDNVKFEIRR